MDYKGIKCPVCEKPFAENDDIVVCPVCGAPYHRDCYNEKGECIFTELHESGEAWAPQAPPQAPNVTSEIKDRECPNCGVLNAHSAMFCNICGTSLTGEPQQHRNAGYTAQHQSHQPQDNDFTGGFPYQTHGTFRGFGTMPFVVDPMGGVNPMEPLAENVTYGEASKIVQQNTGYFMSAFRTINTYKRFKFNFTAFLFSGGWLLYRKQYRSGIIVTALMFLLYIAQTLLSNFGTVAVMMNALEHAGLANSADLSYVQITNVTSQYLLERPGETLLFFSPLICTALMLVIMFIVGFSANKWYMKHCVRTVRKIKTEAHNEAEVNEAYRSRGGVNIAVVFCLFACYMVLQWVPMFFS